MLFNCPPGQQKAEQITGLPGGESFNLDPLYAVESNQDEWNHFEWSFGF